MRAVSQGGKEARWDLKGSLSPGSNDTDSEGPPARGPPARGPPAHCRRWQSRRVTWGAELAILPLPLSWNVQRGY